MSAANVWHEFTRADCAALNDGISLCVVCPDAPRAAALAAAADAALQTLVSQETGPEPAEGALSATGLAECPRVLFTTAAHVETVQGCLAVFGRVPMLAVVDGAARLPHAAPGAADAPAGSRPAEEKQEGAGEEEDEEAITFVLDAAAEVPSAARVAEFLRGVLSGRAARAARGARPPPHGLLPPCKGGVVVVEGRAAVSSTFAAIKERRPACGCDGGGTLALFMSERCGCCPAAMMLAECVVALLRHLARALRCAGAADSAHPFPVLAFVVCSVDANELPAGDWPGLPEAGAPPPTVPTIVGYCPPERRRARLPLRDRSHLLAFIAEHCVPADYPRRAELFAAAAAALARVSEEAVTETAAVSGPAFQAAAAAARALRPCGSAEEAEAVRAAMRLAQEESGVGLYAVRAAADAVLRERGLLGGDTPDSAATASGARGDRSGHAAPTSPASQPPTPPAATYKDGSSSSGGAEAEAEAEGRHPSLPHAGEKRPREETEAPAPSAIS